MVVKEGKKGGKGVCQWLDNCIPQAATPPSIHSTSKHTLPNEEAFAHQAILQPCNGCTVHGQMSIHHSNLDHHLWWWLPTFIE